ncbi:unnamed protein product [Spirodela intermedia]|uniref:Uncharacterized protein n=1 Tax=Spirodela intermedia TaxID=51605 RepID=A0A7I8KYQ1_SPIIN|nr:unnamed protein product [Spirodela intermedia]
MGKATGDVRDWDEEGYRNSVLQERELRAKTIFRTAFSPPATGKPDVIVVASSDGSVSPYSIPSCVASASASSSSSEFLLAQPLRLNQAHTGPAYDVKFYGDGEDAMLLSCGDDGRIRGWRWKEVLTSGGALNPVLDLVNPQHRGPWDALSPVPENNAIATNIQEGSIFSAAGDAHAYCWDVETGKLKGIFKGHKDYLHCIAARNSSNQIITGSEDGSTRLWDCRSGKCTRVIYPEKGHAPKESSWVSCVAVDTSESWLVCGTGRNLSVWSLPSCECIWSTDSHFPVQDVLFHDSQILAVGSSPVLTRYSISGTVISQMHCAPKSAFSVSSRSSGLVAVAGYGGVVDIISEFGSHLCAFRC